MLPERLAADENEARRQGLMSKKECSSLMKDWREMTAK